ncbi:MAG: adenosine kinase [Desulfamplus sp.]|nr:adenosine kinase [Desulfamplus sp.]
MSKNILKHRLQDSRITGVGSALIDFLIHETDDFLVKLGKQKGGMTLVSDSDIEAILKKIAEQNRDNKPVVVPGGATCNTIIGVGKLGGEACFIGKRGNDYYGDFYEDNLKKSNVYPLFHTSATPTGKVLSIITPDAQRSMFTCLGASTELEPESITPEMFNNTGIALMEGYLLFNPDLMMACLKSAKGAGSMIALDLASFEVVEASRDILNDIVNEYVDILIANEDEARAYTGFSDELTALEALGENVSIAVLKVGERGSYISYKNSAANSVTDINLDKGTSKVIRVYAKSREAVKDTTGAGDLWAAGFLYGIANGYSIEKSGEIASACGYEVCQVVGAQIPEHGWQRIRSLL